MDRLDCPTCQFTWAEFGGEPPCATCRPPMTDDIEGPITIYCQCSAVVPVPLMDAIRLAGVDDAAECVRDVQLLAAEVERVRAEDAKKRMAKK